MLKKTELKQVVAFALTAIMVLSMVGCGNDDEVVKVEGAAEFPETLSVFCRRSPSLSENMVDYNDVYSFKLLEEKTGTHIEWTIPPSTGFDEKFNLMVSSGDMPDVVIADWEKKGAQQYAEDEVIIEISDYVKKYMPNLTKIIKEREDLARGFISDDGKIYTVPYMRMDNKLNIYIGPLMRTDWLKKVGMEIPTNADELYAVLKKFKETDMNGNGKADEIPLSATGDGTGASGIGLLALLSMFDTANSFYLKDGKVTHGILEPEFQEGLAYITKLYQEGLVDIDYLLQDRTETVGKITNDRVGFVFDYQPSQVMSTMAGTNPDFKFEGIPHLFSKSGVQRCMISAYNNSIVDSSFAVTTANKNPIGTLYWLDYVYSDEGHMIMNFGKEGDTYEIKDGVPTFTDKIINGDKNGLSRSQVWGMNFGTYNSYFPATQDWNSYAQYLNPYGVQAIETWSKGIDTSLNLPSLTLSAEDAAFRSKTYTPIETYVNENIDKIILGHSDISTLPKVIARAREMGIEKVIEIYQKEYDKYINKKIVF